MRHPNEYGQQALNVSHQIGNPDPIEAALAKQLRRRLDDMRPIGLRLYPIA